MFGVSGEVRMNGTKLKRDPVEIYCAIMMACFYASLYMVMSFATYMVSFGFDAALVASLMSVSGIVSLFLKPLYARWTDSGKCRSEALFLIFLMAFGFLVFFYVPNKTKVVAVIFTLFVSVSCGVMMDLVDSWVVKLSKETGKVDFGWVRSFGSMSFAVTGLVFGFLSTRFGIQIAPYFMIVFLAGMGIITQKVPNPGTEEREKISLKQQLSMFVNKKFLIFTVAFAVASTTWIFVDTYTPVLILERGGTNTNIGINDFVMAGIEFLILPVYTKIADRLGTERTLGFGMLGFCAKACCIALAPTPFLILIATLTQAVSFCLLVPSKMRFIQENIRKEDIATAVSAASLVSSLISILITGPFASRSIPQIGVAKTMMIYGALSLLSGICFLRFTGNRTAGPGDTDD